MTFGYHRISEISRKMSDFGFGLGTLDQIDPPSTHKTSKKTLMDNITGGKKDFSAPKTNSGQLKKTTSTQTAGAATAKTGINQMAAARKENIGKQEALKDEGKKADANLRALDKEAGTGVAEVMDASDGTPSSGAELALQAIAPGAMAAMASKLVGGLMIKKSMFDHADSFITVASDISSKSMNGKDAKAREAALRDEAIANASHQKNMKEIETGGGILHNQDQGRETKAHQGVANALQDGYEIRDIMARNWNDPKGIKEFDDLQNSLADIDQTLDHLSFVKGDVDRKGIRDDHTDEAEISVAQEFNAMGIMQQSGSLPMIKGVKLGIPDLKTPDGMLAFQGKDLVQDEFKKASAENDHEPDVQRLAINFAKPPLGATA